MEPVMWMAAAAVVVVALRLVASRLDRERVAEHVRRQGGNVVSQRWTPFGPGWLGSESERLYAVRYRDAEGELREATVKTSILAGVYFTEDRLVEASGEVQSAGGLATAGETVPALDATPTGARNPSPPGTYMVLERFQPGRRAEVYRRFRERGRMLPPGVVYVGSWIAEDGGTCYQLMRSPSLEELRAWTRRWEDLVDFTLVPVVDSAEAARRFGAE